MLRILVVCLGNICRSPLAEGIFQSKIDSYGLDWKVDSAGTSDFHEQNPPDPRSIRVATQRGIDISEQRSRPIRPSDFENFDHILVMDAMNYQQVRAIAPDEAQDKVELIMNYAYPKRNQQVPDPYWEEDGFDQVYEMLEKAIEAFIEQHSSSQ